VLGGSYGGFMASWLAAHEGRRFKAALVERALTAWDSFEGSSDIGWYFGDEYVGPDPKDVWRQSPLAYADQIRIPTFIVHSEQDWRCPVEQAQRLYVALKKQGTPTELLLFPGEGHELSRSGLPSHRVARFEAVLEWFARWL
jgi:dipeptidyl aminopeptidase/acylaminoacyl peptidase